MSDRHPRPEMLARYARGELPRAESGEVERHLVHCPACQGVLEAAPRLSGAPRVVRWQGGRFARSARPAPQPLGAQAALHTLLRGLGHYLAARTGEAALAALLDEPEHRRRSLLRSDPRFRSLDLCERLAARCRESWLDPAGDPAGPLPAVESAGSIELGKLAVLVAERLDPAEHGPAQSADARALAIVHLAAARRLADLARGGPIPPAAAEEAVREVRDALLGRGMGIDAALATLDLAALHARHGRTAELLALAREAAGAFEAAGLQPYAVDAVRFLCAKAERGEATSELLAAMRVVLQRARYSLRRV